MIMGPQDQLPILKAAAKLDLMAFGPPKPEVMPAPDEWMKRFGTLPLMHQPGDVWRYHTGSEILGVLVARASGKSLEAFFQERIFEPLGMVDTSFSVPASKLDRLATSYWMGQEVYDDPKKSQWGKPPAFAAGGAGLVSTADDFLAFGQMMLDQGAFRGGRILSRPTVEAMTTDQLTVEQKAASPFSPGFWDSLGWGFGMAINTRRDSGSASPGRFGWDGGLGTSWASDPKEGLVGVLLTQRAGFPQMSPIYQDFWATAYQTIDD
jgi:CubicO group peptidase (beta-lactamase class C family)